MKKIYLLLLLLAFSFYSHARTSYRFGVDAGMVGSGYNITVSPILLQTSPSFQLGLGGFSFRKYNYALDYDNVKTEIIDNASYKYYFKTIDITSESLKSDFNPTIQLITLKFDIVKLTFSDNFVPFVKLSSFYNIYTDENYTSKVNEYLSTVHADIKLGLSCYTKRRGSNLSLYVGAMYGAYASIKNSYSYNYTGTYSGKSVESSKTYRDYRTVKLPVLFNFGLQYELGGRAAFGYRKKTKYKDPNKKALRQQRLSIALNALSATSAITSAATDVYVASHTKQSGNNSSTQSSSSSSNDKSSYYQIQYTRWENRAISIYNSVISVDKGVWEDSQKRLFREAQSEMQKVRNKAAKDGVTISRSNWEVQKL